MNRKKLIFAVAVIVIIFLLCRIVTNIVNTIPEAPIYPASKLESTQLHTETKDFEEIVPYYAKYYFSANATIEQFSEFYHENGATCSTVEIKPLNSFWLKCEGNASPFGTYLIEAEIGDDVGNELSEYVLTIEWCGLPQLSCSQSDF